MCSFDCHRDADTHIAETEEGCKAHNAGTGTTDYGTRLKFLIYLKRVPSNIRSY